MNRGISHAITLRNQDIAHIVNAAAHAGVYRPDNRPNKRFSLLMAADIHQCTRQLNNAIDYLNDTDVLDAGIVLGDMSKSFFTETDGHWYHSAVAHAEKPFFTVIGNHDCGNSAEDRYAGTKEEVFNKFIRTTRDKMGMPNLDKTYYAVNFDEYRITLIVLDNYMTPEDRFKDHAFPFRRDKYGLMFEDCDFICNRAREAINQEELDWLVDTLANVPADYHVLIARHSFPESAVTLDGPWTQENGRLGDGMPYYGPDGVIPDVVNAWIKGEALRCDYVPNFDPDYDREDKSLDDSYDERRLFPTLSVNTDFTTRGRGTFIAYVVGHYHKDMQGTSAVYPNQHVIAVPSSANNEDCNTDCDLPRMRGTKAEDCLTVLTVDTNKRNIHLVRVGSNYTVDCQERTHIAIAY